MRIHTIVLTDIEIANLNAGLELACKHPSSTGDDMTVWMALRQSILMQQHAPEKAVAEEPVDRKPTEGETK